MKQGYGCFSGKQHSGFVEDASSEPQQIPIAIVRNYQFDFINKALAYLVRVHFEIPRKVPSTFK